MSIMQKKKKYILSVEDRSRLQNIIEVNFTRLQAILGIVVIMIIIFLLSLCLIRFTPLRRLMQNSDDVRTADRGTATEALLYIDSLQQATAMNQAYLDNLARVFDTKRISGDSTTLRATVSALPPDSLLDRSDREQAFINMMDERERYNTSVLASIAAEGVRMQRVSPTGVQSKRSQGKLVTEIIIPASEMVYSTSEGCVLDVNYVPTERSYSILVQQPRGFVTRYGQMGRILVKRGDHLSGGTPIGYPSSISSVHKGIITIEMWHNGNRVVPEEYIFPVLTPPKRNTDTIPTGKNNTKE